MFKAANAVQIRVSIERSSRTSGAVWSCRSIGTWSICCEGASNLEAREDIKITDIGPIIRTIDGARDEVELVQRRWSWPAPN